MDRTPSRALRRLFVVFLPSRREPPGAFTLRTLLALLLGLLAALAPAQQGPGGGPGGGLKLVGVSGGYTDEGYGSHYPDHYDADAGRGYGGYAHAGLYGDCDGEITYVYRWQGPGDPPQQAVVHLRSYADLEAYPDDAEGAECADGLGDPMVPVDRHGTYAARSQGEKYEVVDLDGDALTVRIHPYSHSPYLSSVWVSVDAAPVTISVSGTKPDSDGNLLTLIGRNQAGSIDAGGYEARNHSWSVSGPQLFASVTTTPTSRQYEPFVGAHADPTVSFYASKDGSETVSCTCDVYVSGVMIGSASAFCGVTVERPTYTISIFPVAGTYTGYTGGNTNPGEVTSGLSTQLPAGGMEFDYTVVNPQDFGQDQGTAALCQLIDESSIIDPSYRFATHGYWLDGYFPYENDSSGVSAYEASSIDKDYDTPYQGLDATDTAFNLNNQFATTSIYQPSGGVFVPLGTKRWSWITTGYHSQTNNLWSEPTGGLSVMGGQTDFDLSKATWFTVRTHG